MADDYLKSRRRRGVIGVNTAFERHIMSDLKYSFTWRHRRPVSIFASAYRRHLRTRRYLSRREMASSQTPQLYLEILSRHDAAIEGIIISMSPPVMRLWRASRPAGRLAGRISNYENGGIVAIGARDLS